MIGYQIIDLKCGMDNKIKNTFNKNQEYIPLSQAGQILNTSRDYVNVLVRRKKLQAVKLGRNWVTTQEWIEEYCNSLKVSLLRQGYERQAKYQDLEKEEKQELLGLKTKLVFEKGLTEILERIESKIENISQPQKSENLKISKFRDSDVSRFKSLEVSRYRDFALTQQIPLSPRKLRIDEKSKILETVNRNFKLSYTKDFAAASKRLGILKSLSSWSNLKLSFSSAVIALFLIFSFATASGFFLGLNTLKFKIFNSLTNQSLKISDNLKASIFSDVFKHFPADFPIFSHWVKDSAISILKPYKASKLITDSLELGKSKIAKTIAFPHIKTLNEARVLDSPFGIATETEMGNGSIYLTTRETKTAPLTVSSVLESRLLTIEDQINLNNSELQIQKKTILGTLETLIGISKFLPSHPISTIVVQGQPATLTTYSVAPSTHSGFDRLSASYLNLSNNAEIKGSLTVKSGGTFDTFSVSGNSTLTGNTTIGGTLSVTGDTTLGNISAGSATTTGLTVQGGTKIGSLDAGAITVTSCNGCGIGGNNSLQNTYNSSTSSPQIILSSVGQNGFFIQDSALGLHLPLFQVNGQSGTSTLFSVSATSTNILVGALFQNATTTGLTVSGGTQLGSLSFASATGTSLGITGGVQLGALNVSGNTNLGNATTTGLSVNGGTSLGSLAALNTYIDGKLGVASTTPSAVLSVNVANTDGVTNAFNISSATSSLFYVRSDGFVGIGISSTSSKGFLTINTATRTSVATSTSNTGDPYALNVVNATSSLFFIGADGRIGIGTTSPNRNVLAVDSSKGNVYFGSGLQVSGDSLFQNATTTGLTVNGGTQLGSLSSGASTFTTATSTSLGVTGGAQLGALNVLGNANFLGAATTTGLYVSGNVGIGTTNPVNKLHVLGGSVRIDLETIGNSLILTGSGSNLQIQHDGGNFVNFLNTATNTNTAGFKFLDDDGATGNMVITNTGNVGIASTSPSAVLSVNVSNAASPTPAFAITSATSSLFFVRSDGLVGIASTSPWGILSVNIADNTATGGGPPALAIRVPNTYGNSIGLNINSATSSLFYVRSDGFIGIGTTSLSLFTTPYATTTQKLSISGNVLISNGGLNLASLTSTTTIAGGFDVGSRAFTVEPFSGLTSIANVEVGATNFESDAGVVSWIDLPVSTTTVSGTIESYSAMIGGTSTITVFGKANGNGVNSIGVGIGTTTPTQMLTISTANATSSVAITKGWLCVDDDGGCEGTAAGSIYYIAAVTGRSDIAENYSSVTSLESGDIVSSIGGINVERATTTSKAIIGIVSSAPGMILGNDKNATSSYSIALSGRVPVKVSLENGPISVGDRIAASSVAGVGKKASSTEATVGIALENFDGTTPSSMSDIQTSSMSDIIPGVGKILVFVNLGQPSLAASKGTGNLAEMTAETTSLNSDLNVNGFSLLNVKSITGLNGLWKIDENGNITAQSVETQKLTVGGGAASGVTIYDRQTTAPKCIYIEGGVIKTSDGVCGTTQNTGTPVTIETVSSPVAPATAPVATTTPNAPVTPTATTTPEIIPVEPIATTIEPIIISETATTTQ